MRMKPASATRSGECRSIAASSAASKAPREGNSRSSTTFAGIPDCAANFRPAASARLLITAATFAGSPAPTIASMLLPRPEIKMTIFFTQLFYRSCCRSDFPKPRAPSIYPLDAVTLLFDEGEYPFPAVEVIRADGYEGAAFAQRHEQAVC